MRFLASVVLLTACGGASAGTMPVGRATIDGRADGFDLETASAAFYLFEPPGRQVPKVLVLVLSDLPDTCAALRQGHIRIELGEHTVQRRGARTLSWMAFAGHVGDEFHELETGRFVLGAPPFEGPSPLPAPPGQPYGFPVASTSRADCSLEYHFRDLFDSDASPPRDAALVLETFDRGPPGVAAGRLEIRLPSGRIAGRFRASRCDLTDRPRGDPGPCVDLGRTARQRP